MRNPRTTGPPRAAVGRPAAAPWTACLARPVLRRTSAIAVFVGICLVLINQLPALTRGPLTAALWIRVALDFLVPFAVSNLGVLTASRQAARQRCGPCAAARNPASGRPCQDDTAGSA